jgi:fructose-1,6-bisphosphatase/inositol monophosphatase family enzyme
MLQVMSYSQPQTIITVTFTAAAAVALAVAATLALSNSRGRHSDSSSSSSSPSSSSSSTNNNKFQIPRALLNSPYASELKLAVRLALQAGRNMYSYCDAVGTAGALSQQLDITIKGGRPEDFCTQIDVENERNIMAAIQSHFPTHNIIGEETVGDGEIPPLSNDIPTWIIDRTYCLIALIYLSLFCSYLYRHDHSPTHPSLYQNMFIAVDGTTNFASGLPLCCVSIGHCVRGRPTVGVVYAPMMDELYVAVAGYGSYRNNVRLGTTTTAATASAPKQKCLRESIVCYEFGYERDPTAIVKMVQKVQAILAHGCRATRSLGSGVLNLCYVASGSYGYPHITTNPLAFSPPRRTWLYHHRSSFSHYHDKTIPIRNEHYDTTGRLDVVYAGVAGESWKPWDYCAGYVIATEAGCVVESFQKKKEQEQQQQEPDLFDLYSKTIICATSAELAQEVRSIVCSTPSG